MTIASSYGREFQSVLPDTWSCGCCPCLARSQNHISQVLAIHLSMQVFFWFSFCGRNLKDSEGMEGNWTKGRSRSHIVSSWEKALFGWVLFFTFKEKGGTILLTTELLIQQGALLFCSFVLQIDLTVPSLSLFFVFNSSKHLQIPNESVHLSPS